MKDFMGKRLVPEERVYENIHAKDGHEFFCVGCGQMFKFEKNLDSLVWFHVDFRPYQCEACEEGLRWNESMSRIDLTLWKLPWKSILGQSQVNLIQRRSQFPKPPL